MDSFFRWNVYQKIKIKLNGRDFFCQSQKSIEYPSKFFNTLIAIKVSNQLNQRNFYQEKFLALVDISGLRLWKLRKSIVRIFQNAQELFLIKFRTR